MAQKSYSGSSSFQPVASGPGNATFECSGGGRWSIMTSLSPAGMLGSFTAAKETPISLALVAGEYLHVRASGNIYVVADTVV